MFDCLNENSRRNRLAHSDKCVPQRRLLKKKNGGCTGWLNVQNVGKTHKKSPKRKITDSRQQQINIFSPNWPLLQHTEQTRILIDFLLTRRFFSHHEYILAQNHHHLLPKFISPKICSIDQHGTM